MNQGPDTPAFKYTPLNILLVEDNEADIKITLRAFQQARIKNNVFVVSDGQACLDFVGNAGEYQDKDRYPRPHIILLDINMPKVDGFGVLSALKQNEKTATIPVIMLSGSKNDDDIRRSYRGGANSFIQKPVSYEQFVEVVDVFNRYWNVLNRLPETE